MLGGTFVALYHGFEKLITGHSAQDLLTHYNAIAIALICSIMFEAWAVVSASKAVLLRQETAENARGQGTKEF